MSAYVSNTSLAEVASRLRIAAKTLVTTHARPDGDAIGSVLALKRAMTQLNQRSEIWVMGPIETPLKDVFRGESYCCADEHHQPDDTFDCIVIADTGAWSQVEPLQDYLRGKQERTIGLDHHARGDADLTGQRVVETSCASTTQLLLPLMKELGVRIDAPSQGKGGAFGSIAEALFVGLATDTGWFKYSNADAKAFAVASELLSMGVNKSELYQLIEERYKPQRLALTARALASLEYRCSGRVAVMTLRLADFQETGGTPEDLTGVVNEPMVIGEVQCSILLSQSKHGHTKLSFRAKPRLDGSPSIDVNELASQFGGGGHPHAAGATVKQPIEPVRQQLETLLAAL